ncbi:MAG: hypothetical protein ACR2HN_04310 [Tepidiformaceae bacterium]
MQQLLSTPARQAAAWAGLGILGLLLGAAGVLVFMGGEDDPPSLGGAEGPTISASATSTHAAASASPAATVTVAPSATVATATTSPRATTAPLAQQPTQGSSSDEPQATPTPPPEPDPTATPEVMPTIVVAGGAYCPTISSSAPPNSVIGLFTVGGQPAPAGTTVGLAFDGVPGPSTITAAAGGYRVDYGAAGAACANRVGAAISVLYNGASYPTGHVIGEGKGPLVRFDLALP